MTRLMSLVLVLLLTSFEVPAANAPQVQTSEAIDRIIAVVNDEIIIESELDARLPAVKRQLAQQRVRLPSDTVLKRGVLERMIMERLQLQVAAQLSLTVSQARVDEAVAQIAKENRLTMAQFVEALKHEGVSLAQVRDQVRTQLLIQQLIDREINNRVSVSEAEVAQFLARNQNRDADAEFNLSHILVAVPETATAEAIEAARGRAETLWNELKAGADFEQLAIANSQDTKALEAGSMGWKKPGQLPALFVSAIDDMEVGGISEIVRSANGFHILKLNDKRGGATPFAVTQSHVRHILIRPNELVSPAEAERRIRALRDRIEHGDDFAALAKGHSDDTASSSDGGDLGWINPGQTVREFENAVLALPVNGLSEPIRTPFGFHLIQVLDRRQQDLSEERNLASARQQIHARKADERYSQWLRQMRDEAFVELKADELKLH